MQVWACWEAVLPGIQDAGPASGGRGGFYRGVGWDMVVRRGEEIGVILDSHTKGEGGLNWGSGCWPGLWGVRGFHRRLYFSYWNFPKQVGFPKQEMALAYNSV